MYEVSVRDHVMIAHSLRGEVFGPSQRLHGATYVVEASVRGPALDGDGVLVDIAWLAGTLRRVLDGVDRRNLDELPEFAGTNSTTEVVARYVADRVAAVVGGHPGLVALRVTLHESPSAWASFERPLGSG